MQPIDSNKTEQQRFPGYQNLVDQTRVIALKDPGKASDLYWKILFCDGSRYAFTKLAREGLDVSRIRPLTGLLGGMQGETISLLGVMKIEITINVDRQWLSREDRLEYVPARACFESGSTIRGKYSGQERALENRRPYLGMRRERFSITPHGAGTFICDEFMYSGDFINGVFQDTSGQAFLHMFSKKSRYTGCFADGAMNGPGLFELIDEETEDFYTHIEGTFKDNKPLEASVYSVTGQTIGSYNNGVYEEVESYAQQDFTRTFSSISSRGDDSSFALVPDSMSGDSETGFFSEIFGERRWNLPIEERNCVPGEVSSIRTFSRSAIEFEDSDCSDSTPRK